MPDILDQNGNPVSQQQPQFPMTQLNIPPDGSGMKITIVLAPGFDFSTTLGPDIMHQIAKQWMQTVKNLQDQLRVIEHVKSTKVN